MRLTTGDGGRAARPDRRERRVAEPAPAGESRGGSEAATAPARQGLAPGMAYPTMLALITAFWSGPARTRSIALWSAVGGAIAALGPIVAGALLEHFWWGSVFLITLPLVVVAFVMALALVPSHVNE